MKTYRIRNDGTLFEIHVERGNFNVWDAAITAIGTVTEIRGYEISPTLGRWGVWVYSNEPAFAAACASLEAAGFARSPD